MHYYVTQMHISKQTKTFYIPKKCAKMTSYGVWNSFHQSIHFKTFGKTVSCSNYTKLISIMIRSITVMCYPIGPCGGIKQK